MTEVNPIGSIDSLATPNIGTQTFLGLTVVDFSSSSAWGGEAGECTINLIQDPELNQYLEPVVVGSPQYFEIVDLNNNPIFRFYGLLSKIERRVNSSGKDYSVVLESPAKLLDAVYVITDVYPGYGGAFEAVHPNTPACLDFGSYNSNTTPANVFNVLNAFGVYENDSYGLNGAGFGKSAVNDDGMRVDFYKYAVSELVNGNVNLTPSLGSNIIFGADAYTNSNAYAYNFDIDGFIAQIASYIPDDYRVKSGNLLQFVTDLCAETNHQFILDLLKPSGSGSEYFTGANHVSQTTPTQTHANTVYGGQIRVITQDLNVLQSTKFPLSKTIIVRESSDKLGGLGQTDDDLPLDLGITGMVHPDGPPVASSPFGGEFPIEEINGTQSSEVYTDTNISLQLNDGTLAKYVIGGYQSRMNLISRTKLVLPNAEFSGSTCVGTAPVSVDQTSNILCYWGSITKKNSSGQVLRTIPVVTPYLDGNELLRFLDIIAIDCSDSFGSLTIVGDGQHNGAMYQGVYLSSVLELRAAMASYESWRSFLSLFKNGKLQAIIESVNEPYNSHFNPIFFKNGNLTEYGRQLLNGSLGAIASYNTSASSFNQTPICSTETGVGGILLAGKNATIENILQLIWQKIKSIGDEHYGKSFLAKVPAYAIKIDTNFEAPLNSYIKSWDLSSDAYLDPVNYASFEAPQSDLFVNNGRLKAYANYDHAFTSYTFQDTGFTLVTNSTIPLSPLGGSVHYFDFSQYQINEVVVHQIGSEEIVSVQADIRPQYITLPSTYFDNYGPENCGSWFFSINSDPSFNLTDTRKQFINVSNGAIQGVSYLVNNAAINDTELGSADSIPYALVKVKPVFLNSAQNSRDHSPTVSDLLAIIGAQCEARKSTEDTENAAANNKSALSYYPVAIMPRAIGVPQQSNRYVYGPWTTNITPAYGGRIEYEQISDLVPENYIIPASLSIGGSTISISSGYTGMNAAGNAIANTVDNFNLLFAENGSVTIAGLPKVQYLGDTLIANGPIVTDVQVNISAGDISTQYLMAGVKPKFGRANEYILRQLQRLGRIAKQ